MQRTYRTTTTWGMRLGGVALVMTVLPGCGGPSAPPPSEPPATPPHTTPGGPLPPPAEPEEARPVSGLPPGRILPLPGGSPEGAVVDPATGILAVALRQPDGVALVDHDSGEVRTVATPGAARHLSSSRPGELLLSAENTDMLIRVALPQGTITEQVQVGRQPHDAASFGRSLFVSNEGGGSVGVVQDGKMSREIPGFAQPGGLTISGDRLVVVDVRKNTLHIIEPTTMAEIAELPAGAGPSHVRPIGAGRVAVADTRGNAVLTYQVTGMPRQISRNTVPGRAYGLSSDPGRGLLYTALSNTNQVVRWRTGPDGSLRDPKTLATVRQPDDVASDPRTGTAYVVGRTDAQVQQIPESAFGPS